MEMELMRRQTTKQTVLGAGAPVRHGERQSGMSLLEVLIASAILLVVVLGLIPLFARAMTSNLSGKESSDIVSYLRSREEQFYQLPFNHAWMTVAPGTTSRPFWEARVRQRDSLGNPIGEGKWQDLAT